jgi:hypothetical protein
MLLPVLAGAIAAQAQVIRPGIDRPLRVGMFKGVGGNTQYWHTNIHTSHTVMAGILANPGVSNLGDLLVVPPAGFTFQSMFISRNDADTVECTSTGCRPTPAQLALFIGALDTLDVLVISSSGNFGALVTDSAQRQAFANFWTHKGYVGIHEVTDTKGTWAPLDTIHGTRFNNHPSEQVAQIRRDSVHQDEAAWQFLNKGLFANGTDTSFREEWLFFTNSGAQIRSRPFLKPTVKLVEAEMTGLSGGAMAMGDHPLSWYRALPTGGRVFYTGMGHRTQVWQGTRAFRRQIYNAILWTAKYDSLSTVSIHPGNKFLQEGAARDYSRLWVSAGILTVTVIPKGGHTVELIGIDGRRIALQKGEGQEKAYEFRDLRAGVYVVGVTTSEGRSRSLVTIR